MGGHYPDRRPQASDGKSFEVLGSWLRQHFLGEEIFVFADAKSQFEIGESREGVEFKELRESHKRLHIEVAERTQVGKPGVESGVLHRYDAA